MSLVQLRTDLVGRSASFGEPVLVDRLARRVRYLRVSLTDRCSMRCTYCMPSEGIEHVPRSEILSLEEVVRVVESFAAWGVERVRLTGGEPTLRRGLVWLVEQLSQRRSASGRPLEVVMTTNGELLERFAAPLAAAGLSALTVSLDSLDPARFASITRRDRLAQVLAGIEAARAAALPLKLNTVAVRGFNDDELGALCRFAWAHGATPRFIELMPMAGGRLFVPGELMPAAAIRARVGAELGAKIELGAQPDGPYGPAQYFVVRGGAHDGRRFGTIAAMTENFCASCNRLRVSATGQLHACLARDDAGDLRRAMRSGEPGRLEQVVRSALGDKRDTHGFERDGSGGPTKAMISIGG
ncbi:GTP 3',8-cyclase MoaA [Enhygromyxa salina]|uniref:GTP 3',8-cyclase MoaA n=1 Tax=Enhygromyxa salina TaxID=215803 RepID=UPI0015E5CC9E|nr:GTP 3',8-cyclase MoaA [Enhygromyxa salina]